MSDKLSEYRCGCAPIPDEYRLWPLYGAGFENLGKDGKPITVAMPEYGSDELLVRHDTDSLCFSDVKVIRAGQEHPRIFRDMRKEPVVLGHEVSMTVVGVGDDLKAVYSVGDRFIVQADVYVDGVNLAYGYMIQGGMSQYTVIDQRVLNGDHGSYLIPVQPHVGYSEMSLTEPWTCVVTAYNLHYRDALKQGGTTWIIGTDPGDTRTYSISAGFDEEGHPDRLLLTEVPDAFADWLRARAVSLGIDVVDVPDVSAPPEGEVDDVVILGTDADLVEAVSPSLAYLGIVAIVADGPFDRKLNIDVGRIHYNRWLYVGATATDIARIYADLPARSELTAGGRAMFVGAGGPMGHIHVQRAIEMENGPATIVCTDISDARLGDLCGAFSGDAEDKGIEFVCLNPLQHEAYQTGMSPFMQGGFDDLVVLAPVAAVISKSAEWLAHSGVMNVFAGVPRGTIAQLDLNDVCYRRIRYIGHSGLTTEDMRTALGFVESGALSPNRLVSAIGSIEAAKDGWQAVADATFPGKVVIYLHLRNLPLTPIEDLKAALPSVHAKLRDGRVWTREAEEELLRVMLA
jgi:D-arabinose 1-dehydrogenase-like Zn-dependent alcohol dehydrogenase